MRMWETIGGGTLWAMVAILMVSAALQPVEVSASVGAEPMELVAACGDGGASPVMGCNAIHL